MTAPAWLSRLTRSGNKAAKNGRNGKNRKKRENNSGVLSNAHMTCSEGFQRLADRYQLQSYLDYAEGKVHTVSVSIGMEHVSPCMLVFSFVGFTLTLLTVCRILRKIRKKAEHQKRYGCNVFPPIAPYNVRETISGIDGKKQPWFLKECAERVGPVFQLNIPASRNTPMVVAVGDLETAKEILQDPKTSKPETANVPLRALAGAPNIFTSDGFHWNTSRNGVAPAFDKRHVDRMNRVCKSETEAWLRSKLENFIMNDESFDLNREFRLLTLKIICKAAFEYNMKESEAVKVVDELQIALQDSVFNNIENSILTVFGGLFPSVRRIREARKHVQLVASKMLEAFRKTPKHLRSQEPTILNCIIQNQKYPSDVHRIADIVMFLYAGYETTSNSLAWTFFELARHPEDLQALRKALNGSDDFLAQAMLKDVIRESMRLRPVLPDIGLRTVGRDFYLKDRAIVIPKGSQIFFPTIVLTRYEVDNAEEFLPSRWREHPEKSFLLFSNGRRNCIGQGLALAEIAWVLSRICSQYDFEVTHEGGQDFPANRTCEGARLYARRVSHEEHVFK